MAVSAEVLKPAKQLRSEGYLHLGRFAKALERACIRAKVEPPHPGPVPTRRGHVGSRARGRPWGRGLVPRAPHPATTRKFYATHATAAKVPTAISGDRPRASRRSLPGRGAGDGVRVGIQPGEASFCLTSTLLDGGRPRRAPEEEILDPAFAQHSPQLPECEERDECHGLEIGAGEDLVQSLSSAETKLFPDRSVVDECAHHVLQDGERRDQKAEHQRLPESGDQEGSIVEPLSEVEDLTDENHLGEDQRLQESQPYSKYPI